MQIYILNRARETLATTASIYNDKHTLTLEAGSSSYEFTINKSDEASHYLDSGNYVVLQDDKGKTWLFTILDYEETHNTKTVYAEDAGIELINKAVDIWKGDGAHPFSYYFDLVTKGTPWKLGVNQLAGLSRTLTYEGRDTGLGRLLSILKGFDNAECTFDVTVKMNAPAEFKINVYKQVGNDRSDVQIVYNNELNDITKKESRAEFVTALAGVGGQIQTENGSEGGNVDFSELEYNKDGFVTKKGDKFLRAVDANRTFNPGQESYIESFYEYDTQSPSELLNRTLSKLKTYSEPQYTYTADVKVIDPSLVLGDTVTILDHDYNPAIYLSARVAKLVKSYTDPTQNEIEFTNYRLLSSALADKLARLQVIVNTLPSASRVSAIETNLTKLTKQQEEVIVKVESANGKNTNFYGGSQPESAKQGDSWFYTDEEGNQGIKQYQNGVWVDVISSKFGPKLKEDIKKAQDDVDEIIRKANNDTTIFRTEGQEPAPTARKKGDLWFKTDNGQTVMQEWDGAAWHEIVSTKTTEDITKQVEQAQADLAQVRADANRISETQTESAKRLDEQMQELRAKTVDNATNVQNVIRDVAQAHADYVAQQADISKQKADLEKTKQSLQTTSQGLDQARQDLLSNSSRIDKLSVGLDGVNINVNNVNSKIDSIQIGGGKNIVRGTSADWQGVHTNEFNGNNNQTFLVGYAYLDQLSAGDSVTISCHYQYSGVTASNAEAQIQGCGNVTGYDNGQLIRPELIALEQGTDLKSGTIKYTFKLNSQMVKNKYWEVRWRFNYVNQGAWFQWCFFKIEKGTTATPWSPAPEEQIEKVAQFKVDLDGIKGTVANAQGDIAQIKLTENGMQQNIKDAQGNISTLQNDAKQFKQQFADVDGNIANLSASAKNFELQMKDAQGNISSLQNDAKGFKQQFADTNGNIATIKRNATELSEQLASKVGNTEYQNFMTQTAKELSQKLVRTDLNGYATTAEVKLTADGLNARFDNLNVGGTNMLCKTKDIDSTVWGQKGKAYYDTKFGEKAIHAWADWSTYVSNQTIHLESNTDYTISASLLSYQENTGGSDGSGIAFGVYAKNIADNQVFSLGSLNGTKGNLSNTEWRRFSTVYHNTTAKDITDFRIEASGDWSTVSGNVWIAKIKLEDGNVPTPWSPAFEDIDDKFEGLSSRILTNSAQFSSVYTKIDNAKTDAEKAAINAIKGDSNWQKMGKIVTNASFLQTADGFAQEVVKEATPMIGGGKNLARGTSDSWQGVYANEFSGGTNFMKHVADVYLDDLSVGDKVTVQIIYQYSKLTATNAKCWLQGYGDVTGWTGGTFYGSPTTITMQPGTDLKSGSAKYTFDVTADMKKNRFWRVTYRFDNVNQGTWFQWIKFKVEKGNVATPWSPAPEDLATKLQLNQVIDTADSHTQIIKDYLTNDNSQFKILKNSVSQKVQKGDVIGQIVLEAGKTLIQNQKLYLDADTVAFSGKAFIPSAAITSLDAGKITTGTLNAAKLNVINLNANSINAGTLSGEYLHITKQTSIDNGVIQGAKIADASIGTAKIADAAITSAKIANLDVNKLSGNKSNFVQSTWNGINNGVTINENGLITGGIENGWAKLGSDGIEFLATGSELLQSVGRIHTNSFVNEPSYNGLNFNLNPTGDYMSWGAKNNTTDDSYTTKFVWHRKDHTAKNNGVFNLHGFTFDDEVTFNGNIYPKNTKGGGTSHIHFYEWNVDGVNGFAIVNDTFSGFWIGNNGKTAVINNYFVNYIGV